MGNGASAEGGAEAARAQEEQAPKKGGFLGKLGGKVGDTVGLAKNKVTGMGGVVGDMVDSAQGFMQAQAADNERKARAAKESRGLVKFIPERFIPAVLPPSISGLEATEEESSPEERLSLQGKLTSLWASKQEKLEAQKMARMEAEAAARRKREEVLRRRREQYAARAHLCDEEASGRAYIIAAEDEEIERAASEHAMMEEALAAAATAAAEELQAKQRQGLQDSETANRVFLEANAVHAGESVLTTCRVEAVQIEKRIRERERKEREDREAAAKLKAAAARRAEELRRKEEELKKQQEEAARIAAAEAEAEKVRLEEEAIAARMARMAAEKQRREEEAARLREERRAAEEARRAEAARKKEADAKRRREAEERRRAEEAARIAAAEEEAERARLEAAAEAARKEREEAEARRRREEELAAQLAAASAADDDASDSSDEDVAVPAEPEMEGTKSFLFKGDTSCCKIEKGSGTAHEKWGWYNGKGDWALYIKVEFSGSSSMKPLGKTTTEKLPDGYTRFELLVEPYETAEFCEGRVNGWRSSYGTRTLSDEYNARIAAERAGKVNDALAKIKAMGLEEDARVAQCVAQNIRYVDPDFPPRDLSLTGKKKKGEKLAVSPWCTPEVFLQRGIRARMVTAGITMDDIDQGGLGDCWFLSAIACVAEYPNLIKNLLRPPIGLTTTVKAERKIGVYRLWLCKSGWWKNWVVDEHMPGASARRFAQNKQEPSEMWVSVMEKAYAKAHQGFANIIGGHGALALRDLTGYPTSEWGKRMLSGDEAESTACFKQLVEWDGQGYLQWTATHASPADGLVGNHAYSLTAAVEADGRMMVRLRNPWGRGEWKGRWSDGSTLWGKHPAVAAACEYSPDTDADDGAFWIEWCDLKVHMDCGTTCFVRPTWADLRVRVPMARRRAKVGVFIHVSAPVDVYITMWQPNTRASDYSSKPHLLSLAEGRQGRSGAAPSYSYTHHNQEYPGGKSRKVYSYEEALVIATRLAPTHPGTPYFVYTKPWDDAESDAPWTNTISIASDKPPGAAFKVEFREVPADHDAYFNSEKFNMDPSKLALVDCEYQVAGDPAAARVYGTASAVTGL